jgi:hypothetical protein
LSGYRVTAATCLAAAETVTSPDSTAAMSFLLSDLTTVAARCTVLRETFSISAALACGKESIDSLPPVY